MSNKSPTLITTAEAAVILNRDETTVSRMVARGELPFAKKMPGLRGAFVFDESVVKSFAASRDE